MIIKVDKSFKKDFLKLKNKEIEYRILKKLNEIEKVKTINNISNIKLMKWFNNFYRIRIWNFRIWFKFENNEIILLRVRSRKDIYNIFP